MARSSSPTLTDNCSFFPFVQLAQLLLAGATKSFKIVYELPDSVGNEIMGDSATFNINASPSQQ
jgi:hypothetical protein